jgi:hypothetical protein
MDVGLAIAGVICVAMAIGHTTIGVVWVLPSLTKEVLPETPFGPPSMSVTMVRVTWYVVTIFVLVLGGLLMTLAWSPDADSKTLLLRWFAAGWLAATATAAGVAGRRLTNLRALVRLPVPVLWVVVAVLLWRAST